MASMKAQFQLTILIPKKRCARLKTRNLMQGRSESQNKWPELFQGLPGAENHGYRVTRQRSNYIYFIFMDHIMIPKGT